MPYTIQQVSHMTGIPATTLRYYDKEGLLPFLERRPSGYRAFSDIDLSMLQVLQCLKDTGMSIEEMKQFSLWVQEGDASLKERYEMFVRRKATVEGQIAELQKSLKVIEHKMNYYKEAVASGTEKHLMGKDTLPYAEEFRSANKTT
ncbi:MAG: MerR family transcriptional regulator [Selenomonadaceae bacterium]|nr:MerR family transcriptional regulator [Selenomonadaceae bacterium]